jgi:hypothetical protein
MLRKISSANVSLPTVYSNGGSSSCRLYAETLRRGVCMRRTVVLFFFDCVAAKVFLFSPKVEGGGGDSLFTTLSGDCPSCCSYPLSRCAIVVGMTGVTGH